MLNLTYQFSMQYEIIHFDAFLLTTLDQWIRNMGHSVRYEWSVSRIA